MTLILPAVLPRVRAPGDSASWVEAFDVMAAVETLAGGPYGLRRAHSLPPENLSGECPEAVRWVEGLGMYTRYNQGPALSAHPGGLRYHDLTVKIFVVMGPRAARQEDLMRASAWVPVAWDEAYSLNRTLDGACRLCTLDTHTAPARYQTNVGYGRLQGRLQLWQGWIFTALLRLQYLIGAS